MRYKVGDRVKVRKLKDGYESPSGMYFNDDMERLAGTIVTIKDVIIDKYRIEEDNYNWVDDFFEVPKFSKDLITNLSVVTLANGDRLVYNKEMNTFYDLNIDYDNDLSKISDIESDGRVKLNRVVKIEQPNYITVYEENEVREMTVEEISKVLGYEVKIVKEKR